MSNYYEFFYWYLGDSQMVIEKAFKLSLLSSMPMFLVIVLIHFFYYPTNTGDSANVVSFPPIIFLFSMNLAFTIAMSNMYHYQIYQVPEILNIFRSPVVGTSSARRKNQLLLFREDVKIKELRGNVPTRVNKLSIGNYDGIVLAKAGLNRLELDLSSFFVVDLH